MILLGNTFPLSLIRRPVRIVPASLDELKHRAGAEGVVSFWGHENTRAAAAEVLGFDPAPSTSRPSITLSGEKLPMLEGRIFDEVWVLSPDLPPGFRPQVGQEVSADQILSWQVLCVQF